MKTTGSPSPAALARENETATPLKVGIHTLGCRLNIFESDGILSRFQGAGRYEIVPLEEGPDIAIVNTCTVTDQADSRNRNIIRGIIKKNPRASVVVTGCFAQTDPEKIKAIPGVSLVVGNDKKSSIFDLVDELVREAELKSAESLERIQADVLDRPAAIPFARSDAPGDAGERSFGAPLPGRGLRPLENPFDYGDAIPQGHTRAYMKIQDGCDRRCTYCKIPQARGLGVSRPAAEILEHVRRLDEAGVPEIVLTGVNLGWYRDRAEAGGSGSANKGGMRFNALIQAILDTLRHGRLRISSIEPCDVDAGLGELSLHPRFCDFLHVPLQSGSRRILRAMKRTYTPESFRKRVETVLRINPNLFIGTDIITGFPGETADDFQDSVNLCRDLGVANIHAFRFSPRAGTPAAEMKDRAPHALVKERMLLLKDEKLRGWKAYARKHLDGTREAVIEKNGPEGGEALTDNFLRLEFQDAQARPRELRSFRLLDIADDFRVRAEPLND